MIEEEHIRFVAAADVTDDCRVEAEMRKRRQTLTASQARQFAAELVRAAGEAESAAAELVRPVAVARFDVEHVHPECIAGKCGNCDGEVLTLTDEWVPCAHQCHEDGAA
ncbi:hypothetical protein K8F61_05270 [Microbacterium resistens]|uniref:DksA C4-type domain-containing protein n=1 Tax=Microbacterium resistens TaxID=156977 RepID=A0ABY3RXF2_9MICO|nr:hypothetical protein [Microbacterium resistens]UGS27600.1 hypothetical protein K8F61_05270 [Microbacterium resistens]